MKEELRLMVPSRTLWNQSEPLEWSTRCGLSCDFETGQVAYGRHQLRCFIGHDQTISETLDQGGNARRKASSLIPLDWNQLWP